MSYDYFDEEDYLSILEANENLTDYYSNFDLSQNVLMQNENDESFSSVSFSEIFENCVLQTTYDGASHIGKILIWCFIFRISSQTLPVPYWIAHGSSIFCGLMVLFHFFYINTLYLTALASLSVVSLYLCFYFSFSKYQGLLISVIAITFNLLCESLVASPVDWHQIRGAQMILSMKMISLAFDIESQGAFPSILSLFAYALSPGNVIFGPWVSYESYLTSVTSPKWSVSWFLKICWNTLMSFLFLSISTCWTSWLFPDDSWRWWIGYRDALSFRTSHYFVSYVSVATALASGLGDSNVKAILVTQPQFVEFPRSLVQVVISWNIPLHNWLKKYIFKKCSPHGSLLAVLATYLFSVLLHGLNFQLAAVLFSLGLFSYIETKFRRALSKITNASLEAKRPLATSYKFGESLWCVRLLNFFLGLLAFFHLNYLGVMFAQDSNSLLMMEEGYSWRHTLDKWSGFHYISHWIHFFTLILTFSLSESFSS